jgi:hypothetical protein
MDYQKYYNQQISQEGGRIDYKNYYLDQLTGSGLPVFMGYGNQKGHGQYGQGGIFRALYNWILPLFKTHAIPLLKEGGKVIGTEVLKSATNVANDAIVGNNVKTSLKENFAKSLNRLSEKANESLLQRGKGYKRVNKRKVKFHNFNPHKFKPRKLIDVFDKL